MVRVIEVQTNIKSVAMSLKLNGWDILPSANGIYICWKKYNKETLKSLELFKEDIKVRLI